MLREKEPLLISKRPYWATKESLEFVHPSKKVAFLPEIGQIVKSVPLWEAPAKAAPKGKNLLKKRILPLAYVRKLTDTLFLHEARQSPLQFGLFGNLLW